MVDIIFLLLLFFAVSTTLIVNNEGLKLQLPSSETVSDDEKRGVVLSVDENQAIYLDKRKINEASIRNEITLLLSEKPDLQVILQADQSTPYARIISILDQIRLAGCYDLVLEAEKTSKNEG